MNSYCTPFYGYLAIVSTSRSIAVYLCCTSTCTSAVFGETTLTFWHENKLYSRVLHSKENCWLQNTCSATYYFYCFHATTLIFWYGNEQLTLWWVVRPGLIYEKDPCRSMLVLMRRIYCATVIGWLQSSICCWLPTVLLSRTHSYEKDLDAE